MKPWIVHVAALTLAFDATAAAAQTENGPGAQGGGRGGAAVVRGACRAEIEQFCGNTEPGGGRIGQCLREHQDRLSEACQSAIATMRANRREHRSGAPMAPDAPSAPTAPEAPPAPSPPN